MIRLAPGYHAAPTASLAVRPDSVHLDLAGGVDARAEGTVELCTWLGATVEHVVRLAPDLTVLTRGPGLGPNAVARHRAGTRVALYWAAEDEFLFDAEDHPMIATVPGSLKIKEKSHA